MLRACWRRSMGSTTTGSVVTRLLAAPLFVTPQALRQALQLEVPLEPGGTRHAHPRTIPLDASWFLGRPGQGLASFRAATIPVGPCIELLLLLLISKLMLLAMLRHR